MTWIFHASMLDHYRDLFQRAKNERQRLFLAEQILYHETEFKKLNN